MLATSIFSFSNNVFFPSRHKIQVFSHNYFVVCKCLEFGQVLNIVIWQSINSLPNGKILDWSKFKALADDKINRTKNLNLFWEGYKTFWESKKMFVTSIFLLFPKCFQSIIEGRFKLGLCDKELNFYLKVLTLTTLR